MNHKKKITDGKYTVNMFNMSDAEIAKRVKKMLKEEENRQIAKAILESGDLDDLKEGGTNGQ